MVSKCKCSEVAIVGEKESLTDFLGKGAKKKRESNCSLRPWFQPNWEQLEDVIPIRLWMTAISWVLTVSLSILKVEPLGLPPVVQQLRLHAPKAGSLEFDPWSRKIPDASGQLSPPATTTEPVLCNWKDPAGGNENPTCHNWDLAQPNKYINKSDDLKKQKTELFINANESVIDGGWGRGGGK